MYIERFIFKKAFTLAEIMIALVVIGVITSILLPVAFNNVPNENVMKFKKGNATLAKVINELVTSGEYYTQGDLGKDKNGNWVEDTAYFCSTIADVLNTKEKVCENIALSTFYNNDLISTDWNYNKTRGEDWKFLSALDDMCKKSKAENYVITPDGVMYYENNANTPFGINNEANLIAVRNFFYSKMNTAICGKDIEAEKEKYGDNYQKTCYGNGFYYVYKPFCMDIDGINQGEDPFGYAIRVDGKIILGARAQEWMEKSIQDKE